MWVGLLLVWKKYEPFIREHEIRYNMHDFYSDFEYLASDMTKFREEKGFSAKIPETFTKYVKEDVFSESYPQPHVTAH